MLKIKNTLSLAAVLCGLFICFAAATQNASAQFIPPGSYQKSCKNIKTVGATLYADCNRKGETLGDKIGGRTFVSPGPIEDYFLCEGDIWNDDSLLMCKKNTNSALMEKNAKAIEVSYNFVTGQNASFNGTSVVSYVREMFKKGMAEQFYKGSYGFINTSLNSYFLDWLSEPEQATTKAGAIDRAFQTVYSWGVSPKDLAFYNAQKVGYQGVIAAEQKKLNADKVIRRLVVAAAYKRAMGRNPTAAEFDYWQPKQEYYNQLVAASRAFLYAPNGAKDLTETVKRALADHGNDKPTIEQINAAIVKYSQKKAIFDEM